MCMDFNTTFNFKVSAFHYADLSLEKDINKQGKYCIVFCVFYI